jgi:DNA-binding beta-propeller fold protein YncE
MKSGFAALLLPFIQICSAFINQCPAGQFKQNLTVFLLDQNNNMVRKLDSISGIVSTLAGSGSGFADGAAAKFKEPCSMAVSPDAKFALVADSGNNRIRWLDLKTNIVSTFSGGLRGFADGADAQFNDPTGIAISPNGKYALIADYFNHRIRKLDLTSKIVTTVAGGDAGFSDGVHAQFCNPYRLTIAPSGTYALVADAYNHRIRRLDLSSYVVSTVAGGMAGYADGMSAEFNNPTSIAISPDETFVLVADSFNNRIRRIELPSGRASTFAGSASGFADGSNALFRRPSSVAIMMDRKSAIVTDDDNHRVRKLDLATGEVMTLMGSSAGYADGIEARFDTPNFVALLECAACEAGTFPTILACRQCQDGTYLTGSGSSLFLAL